MHPKDKMLQLIVKKPRRTIDLQGLIGFGSTQTRSLLRQLRDQGYVKRRPDTYWFALPCRPSQKPSTMPVPVHVIDAPAIVRVLERCQPASVMAIAHLLARDYPDIELDTDAPRRVRCILFDHPHLFWVRGNDWSLRSLR